MTPVLERDSILVRSRDIPTANVDGEVVALSVEAGQFYAIKGAGARVWEMLEEPRSVASIISALLDTFDVGHEQCERETLAFLDRLVSHQLVRITTLP